MNIESARLAFIFRDEGLVVDQSLVRSRSARGISLWPLVLDESFDNADHIEFFVSVMDISGLSEAAQANHRRYRQALADALAFERKAFDLTQALPDMRLSDHRKSAKNLVFFANERGDSSVSYPRHHAISISLDGRGEA